MPTKIRILALLAVLPTSAFSKEQHGAHEHGKATLSIALDGNTLSIRFESPADSIYGFEHVAKSASDIAARDKAIGTLKNDPLSLFSLNSGLGCKIAKADVDPFAKDDHDPADHKAKSNADSKTEAAQHGEHGEHAEVHATYTIACDKSPVGTELSVNLFAQFSRLNGIETQYISDKKQHGKTLTKAAHAIGL